MLYKKIKKYSLFILLLLCVMFILIGKVSAETDTLIVKRVEGDIALYNTIKIEVENIAKWASQPNHDVSKFIIQIDGIAFKSLMPSLVDDKTKLQFELKRIRENKKNKDAWTTILSRRPKQLTREVFVSLSQKEVKVTGEVKAVLIVINKQWFWGFIIFFTIALAFFGYIAYNSDIIRETGPQPTGKDKFGRKYKKPYSLARTQMSFWFFIVIMAYIFIWIVTRDLSNLTPSVLGLIGISTCTGLGAAIVDSSKRSNKQRPILLLKEDRKKCEIAVIKLQNEIKILNNAIAISPPPIDLDEKKALINTKQVELAAKQKEIEQINLGIKEITEATNPPASKHFIYDILSDDDGLSFHRFQIFAWTIVLIFIFCSSVYNILIMPDFDATLLALMGISGGTYIGFKMPDQQG
jgi:hypothetical protein